MKELALLYQKLEILGAVGPRKWKYVNSFFGSPTVVINLKDLEKKHGDFDIKISIVESNNQNKFTIQEAIEFLQHHLIYAKKVLNNV